ncbi:MAG: helix-turn-helix domain-containing protein [Ekhidna sp.]|nr:helix-turn-helix domain-containing protein [Ekhidna sp.]
MILNHSAPHINGIMRLVYEEDKFERNPFIDSHESVLTIAWNRGSEQTVVIDGEELCLPANYVVVLEASQSFSFGNPQSIVALQFNRDFYCIVDHDHEVSCSGLLFYGNRKIPTICLNEKEQKSHGLLFEVFVDEFGQEDDNLKTEMLRILLKRLIVKLTRSFKGQSGLKSMDNRDLDVIRQFNLLVDLHFRKYHQVQDYSDLINKSPKTISNLFSKYSDKSPLETIHARILMEAKRLLIYTDKTTKEIAYEIGFQDIPSFSRFFKKRLQLAPSKYRESQKNL